MATDQWEIRLVRPEDNVVLAQVLREVLIEMKVPFDGTALSDPELDATILPSIQDKNNDQYCLVDVRYIQIPIFDIVFEHASYLALFQDSNLYS